MSDSRVLYCHLDNFYASVEQHDRPDLRGRPVVVGGSPFPQGRVISASAEACALGIHPALPIKTAYQLCPQAVFLLADFTRYRTIFKNILYYLYADFTDRVESNELGGAFLEITGCPSFLETKHSPSESECFASTVQGIKVRLEREYGLKVSIGVATSKGVALVASHCQRPSGLTVVSPRQEKAFLAPLPIGHLDLEPEVQHNLSLLGISNIGQLAALPLAATVRKFGPSFAAIHRLANGDDPGRVSILARPPEIGVEAIFDFGLDASNAATHLPMLAERVANQLNGVETPGQAALRGRVVILRLYTGRVPLTLSTVLKAYTAEVHLILRAAQRLLSEGAPDEPIEGLRLAMTDLISPQFGQLSLFPNREARLKSIKGAIQGLQQRYGPRTLLRVVCDPMATLTEQPFYLAEVENDESTILQTRSGDSKAGAAERSFLAG